MARVCMGDKPNASECEKLVLPVCQGTYQVASWEPRKTSVVLFSARKICQLARAAPAPCCSAAPLVLLFLRLVSPPFQLARSFGARRRPHRSKLRACVAKARLTSRQASLLHVVNLQCWIICGTPSCCVRSAALYEFRRWPRFPSERHVIEATGGVRAARFPCERPPVYCRLVDLSLGWFGVGLDRGVL